jgi:ATP-dependent Clp protease ATP-binding subunit ClpA
MSESSLPHHGLPEDDDAPQPEIEQEEPSVAPVERVAPVVNRIIERAEMLARERGHTVMTTDDLFAALVTEPDCAAARVLESIGFSGAQLVQSLAFILGRNHGNGPPPTVEHSPRVVEILATARAEAGRRRAAAVDTLHLMAALLRSRQGVATLVLETPGLGLEPVGAAINRAIREGATDPA